MASTIALFDDLVRCETRLYNAVDDRLRERHGLGAAAFELLRHIRNHPGARVADLAQVFAVGIGATSKGVDRYARSGWVRREPNPDDRRSSLLTLTDAGAALVAEAESTFAEAVEALVEPVIGAERRTELAAALSTLRRALERERIGLPTG